MSALFSPFALREQRLANRIVVSPTCQYSADDGCVNDWDPAHPGQLALSGAGRTGGRGDASRSER
jgi:2,4-dienoyl-CoA reductase-like NADH-dependent reductase (Old Yellow Enzyme family)